MNNIEYLRDRIKILIECANDAELRLDALEAKQRDNVTGSLPDIKIGGISVRDYGAHPDALPHVNTKAFQAALDAATTDKTSQAAFDPSRGFWCWCPAQKCAVFLHSPPTRCDFRTPCLDDWKRSKFEYLRAIGNCFATREEAEDEGKWRFETKLVLDEKLRVLKKRYNLPAVQIAWMNKDNDSAMDSRVVIVTPKYGTHHLWDFIDDVKAILGSDAKRYLTGEK